MQEAACQSANNPGIQSTDLTALAQTKRTWTLRAFCGCCKQVLPFEFIKWGLVCDVQILMKTWSAQAEPEQGLHLHSSSAAPSVDVPAVHILSWSVMRRLS